MLHFTHGYLDFLGLQFFIGVSQRQVSTGETAMASLEALGVIYQCCHRMKCDIVCRTCHQSHLQRTRGPENETAQFCVGNHGNSPLWPRRRWSRLRTLPSDRDQDEDLNGMIQAIFTVFFFRRC